MGRGARGDTYGYRHVTPISKVPQGMKLSWNSLSGKIYRVAYKNNSDAPWSDLSGNITASDLSSSWIDTTANAVAQRFYTVCLLN